MIIAIVGIVFGILVMTYSEIDTVTREATWDSIVDQDKNFTQNTWDYKFVNSTWTSFNNTLASVTGVVISNATFTGVVDTDYELNLTTSKYEFTSFAYGGRFVNNSTYYIDYSADSDGTASINKVSANTYKGFNLGSIAPIVLAAGLIISIVIGFAGIVLGKRGE